ncbi:MAG: DUF262 domain-containing HNH endonuclease family protein [Pseudomonadota bacterium]
MTEPISAQILPLEAFFELGTFAPASVQRSFKWGTTEADQLLRDMLHALKASEEMTAEAMLADIISGAGLANDNIDATSDGVDVASADEIDDVPDGLEFDEAAVPTLKPRPASFFLGTVILHPATGDRYQLYDGLQRVTTLTILLSVLRDLIEEPKLKARLHATVAKADGAFRLTHRGASEMLTRLVQPMGEAARVRRRAPPFVQAEASVYAILRSLRQALDRRAPVAREALARFVLEKAQVAVIFTSEETIARHAFVATNLYGIRLSRDEIFKGELIALSANEDEAARMLALWDEILVLIGGRDVAMRDPWSRGEHRFSQMEAFLLVADVIERRAEQGADCLGDLIQHLQARNDERPVILWLENLRKLAQAWSFLERAMRNPKLGSALEREIFKLRCIPWQDWRPIAIYWLMGYFQSKREKTAVDRFRFLHSRCMAMCILELDADQRAHRFREALKRARRGAPFSTDRTNLPLNFKDRFRQRIKERLLLPLENHEVRRALILWYDLELRTALPGDPENYFRNASIEHVLPRKPEPKSQWLVDFPDSEERYLRFTSLGNLGVIDHRLQKPAANHDWAGDPGKRSIFVKAQQHIKYNSLAGIDRFERWTSEVITYRATIAAEFIWERLLLAEPM